MATLTYQQHEITKNLRTDLITNEETRTNEGNKLARQPNLMGSLGLNYNNNKFDAFVNANYIGSKFTADDNKIELDPYTLVRLGAGYTMKAGDNGENFRLGFNIFNVTDSQGITEGNPRALDQTEEAFFFGRPELPRRFFVTGTLNF